MPQRHPGEIPTEPLFGGWIAYGRSQTVEGLCDRLRDQALSMAAEVSPQGELNADLVTKQVVEHRAVKQRVELHWDELVEDPIQEAPQDDGTTSFEATIRVPDRQWPPTSDVAAAR